jgi:DNA modification methylase
MSAPLPTSELAERVAGHSFAPVTGLGFRPYHEEASVIIYHGDCRQIVPMLGRFDLLLTDPPYGIGAHKMTLGNGRKKVYRGEQSWDDAPPTWELDMVRAAADRQIIWGGNYFGMPPARGWLFWDKGTGDNDYADGELAWTNLETVLKKFTRSWVGANAKDRDSAREHPTQKPLTLMQWCIQLAGDVETILDPFAGSGTTGRAAKDLGKKCVLVEREERYCEIAAKRLAQDVLPLGIPNIRISASDDTAPQP